MAEVIGTVAASLQLIDTLKRTWELWQDMENASMTIQHARRTINNLELALRRIENCHLALAAETSNDVMMVLDTINSKLRSIQDELANCAGSKSRALGKFKFVLHKASIMQAFGDIEREKTSLDLINSVIIGEILIKRLQSIQVSSSHLLSQSAFSSHPLADLTTEMRTIRCWATNVTIAAPQFDWSETYNKTDEEEIPSAFTQRNKNQSNNIRQIGPASFRPSWKFLSSASTYQALHKHRQDGYRLQDAKTYTFHSRFGSLSIDVSTYNPNFTGYRKPYMRFSARLILYPSLRGSGKVFEFQFQESQDANRFLHPIPSLKTARIIKLDSPAGRCIARGDLTQFQHLLEERLISAYDCSQEGIGYLHVAAAYGRLEFLKTLVMEGADVEIRDSDHRTALDVLHEYAPQALDTEVGSPQDEPFFGRSRYDLLEDFKECCLYLEGLGSSSGESFDLLGPSETSLQFRTGALPSRNTLPNLQKWGGFIREIGVNINGFYGTDSNALISACCAVDSERVKILLNLGADVNATCRNGKQAIHHIFDSGYWGYEDVDIVKSLLLAGASLESKDNQGLTPQDYAMRTSYLDLYKSVFRATKQTDLLDSDEPSCEWHAWFNTEIRHRDAEFDLDNEALGLSQLSAQTQQRLNEPDNGSEYFRTTELTSEAALLSSSTRQLGLSDMVADPALTFDTVARILFYFFVALGFNTLSHLMSNLLEILIALSFFAEICWEMVASISRK